MSTHRAPARGGVGLKSAFRSVPENLIFATGFFWFSPTGEAAVVSGVFGGVVGKIEVVLVSKTNFVLRLGWVRGFGFQI